LGAARAAHAAVSVSGGIARPGRFFTENALAGTSLIGDDACMAGNAGLAQFEIVAFVTIRDPEKAISFYRDRLGLRLVNDERPFAIVFDAHGTMLRLAISPDANPVPGTVLGWRVPNIEVAVRDLLAAGVVLERYGFMQQDDLGIWSSPSGAKVAWFKDPDGNVLSLSYHPEISE
jgi:catechol 2,3-dioxygenase-like lactoylglutathione lyase family enzyme